jgi:hypothetical protein
MRKKQVTAMKINMTNFKIGVTDDKYKLPPGVKISDMNNLCEHYRNLQNKKKQMSYSGIMKDVEDYFVVSVVKEAKDESVQ